MNKVDQQAAFILKSQTFNETSSIHQVFTQQFGILSLISKGSKASKSKVGSSLQAFNALSLSWRGKAELKTITSVEQSEYIQQLTGNALFCGFYINELLLNFLHKHDPHPELFGEYNVILKQLAANDNIEANLRQFEKKLLNAIGYAVLLDYDAITEQAISADMHYHYQPQQGATITALSEQANVYSGSMLINLNHNQLSNKTELRQAKRLMRLLIDYHLGGKILKSRELFGKIKTNH